jgi:hypothetical protein
MTTIASAVADLQDAGPGGMCDECGHFACRHSNNDPVAGDMDMDPDRRCFFHLADPSRYSPCKCTGMKWQGVRVAIYDGAPDYARSVLDPRNDGME